MAMPMSARPVTVVVVVALSLPAFGSTVVVATVAVFDRVVPSAVFAATVTMMVSGGAAVATARETERVQVTVVVPLQAQPVPLADTNVVPAGIVSLTLIPLADVPVEAVLLLVTVMV